MRLSKEELEAIEKAFAKELERNPEKMIAQYREMFCQETNYICNDNALELCPGFKDAPPEQKRLVAGSMSIRQTAGKVVYGTFDQMLKELPPAGTENIVTFVAGGAGSGKSHFIKEHPVIKEIIHQTSHIVFEVVQSFEEANIERALNAGKDAFMLFVYRPIEAAAKGALARAEEIGRIPNFDYLCNGHLHCQKEMKFLSQIYQNNDSLISVIGDNTKNDEARILEPNTRRTLEFLQNNAYKDSREVRDRAFNAVQKYIGEREKAGKPVDKELVQYYVGKEQAEREKTKGLARQKDQEQERAR